MENILFHMYLHDIYRIDQYSYDGSMFFMGGNNAVEIFNLLLQRKDLIYKELI